MNSNKSVFYRIVVYLVVFLIVIGAGFSFAAGSSGLDNWVSYLIVGILAGIMLILIVANEIYIHVLKKRKGK